MTKTLVGDIIKSSLQSLGIIAPGDNPEAGVMAACFETLNRMLSSWLAADFGTGMPTDFSVDIKTGDSSNVHNSFVKVTLATIVTDNKSNDVFDVEIVDMSAWNAVLVRSVHLEKGRPQILYPSWDYRSGGMVTVLKWFPNSDQNYVMTVYTDRSFPVYDSVADDFGLPPPYERAVESNLAVEVAPKFGVTVPSVTMAVARESRHAIGIMNQRKDKRRRRLPFG